MRFKKFGFFCNSCLHSWVNATWSSSSVSDSCCTIRSRSEKESSKFASGTKWLCDGSQKWHRLLTVNVSDLLWAPLWSNFDDGRQLLIEKFPRLLRPWYQRLIENLVEAVVKYSMVSFCFGLLTRWPYNVQITSWAFLRVEYLTFVILSEGEKRSPVMLKVLIAPVKAKRSY